MANVPPRTVKELSSVQNKFIWKSQTPESRHSTLVADCQDGGVKNVDIATKLKALNSPVARTKQVAYLKS